MQAVFDIILEISHVLIQIMPKSIIHGVQSYYSFLVQTHIQKLRKFHNLLYNTFYR